MIPLNPKLDESTTTDDMVEWLKTIAQVADPNDAANLTVCAERLHALYYGDWKGAGGVPWPDGQPHGWPPDRAVSMASTAASANMPTVIRRVQRGERIGITLRGKPVAVVCPVERAE